MFSSKNDSDTEQLQALREALETERLARTEAENRLKELRQDLDSNLRDLQIDEALEAEKEFLANISHEIRNPINAINGLLNLLYDTDLSNEQLGYLDNIKEASDILLRLISDILDISNIEAGKLELNERPVDLGETLRSVVQTFAFSSKSKELVIESEFDSTLDKKVEADPRVINQILVNIIGNAVKFTEKGRIVIRASTEHTSDGNLLFHCEVEDTGIGITKDRQSKIFDRFQQANRQTKLKYGGTGLGLAIVKRLVEIYSGEINVKSTPGKGSTFWFTLKLTKLDTSERVRVSNQKPVKIERILIVEDNRINQEYLVGLMKKWGLAYDLADNGKEALEFIEKEHYDVILMDIRMPEMDGYETTIRIRNLKANTNSGVPIIALTASALIDEKKRALEAGMNHHLTKPFSPTQLKQVIGSMTTREEPMVDFEFSNQLDVEYLEHFYLKDYERAAVMFQIFVKNIPRDINQLIDAYSSKDFNRLTEIAHRIKPNFSMVGLTESTSMMIEVEKAGSEQNHELLKQIIPKFLLDFKNKLEIVKEELDRMNSRLKTDN